MRFVLDEDVDIKAVRPFLLDRDHDCWSVGEAGLGGSDDDAVAIYADDYDAVLITHDAEATRRRRGFTFGRHLFLHCHQLDAIELLTIHITEIESEMERHQMGVVEVRRSGVTYHPPQYRAE